MKNTRSISRTLGKFSATPESTLQNNKTCTPRYSYGEYSQFLFYGIQPILFKNDCNYWAAEAYLEPSRKSTMDFSCKKN